MSNSTTVKPPNRIAGDKCFKDKTLLVTGATGFLGKVFVEKVLRTCPLVKKIYVLVRPKKGRDSQSRVKEMFTNPLFDLLKKTRGAEILTKVVAIPGDVSKLDLGLTNEDRQRLANEVQMIFHMAATIRFDDPFEKSVLLNVRGTKLMLEFAKECKKLLVFVHVSTAYSYPHERVLYEKAYPPPANPHDVIKVAELLDEDITSTVAKNLKGDYPNTYTYTKALAEGLVNEQMDHLPVIILRPSVVIPVWKDPLPGWTDNLNGPAGLLVAAGKGVLRTMYCNENGYADFVPVDIAVNFLMLAAYDYLTYGKRRIGNITSSSQLQVTWAEIIEIGRKLVTTRMPLNWAVWYPGGSMKSSRLLHNICVVLFHYIPAIFLDSLIILTGNKPVLWRVQQRITKGFELFEFYGNNQWDFNVDSSLEGRKLFNETEREIYKIDEDGLDIEEYFCACIHATRLYVLKEGDETLATARRHMKIMWALDKLCKTVFLFGVGYLLLKYIVYPLLDIE